MTRSNLVNKAIKMVEEAENNGISLRILGAVAVKIHSPRFSYLQERMGRTLTDIDLVGYSSQRNEIIRFMNKVGFEVDRTLLDYLALTPRLVFVDKYSDIKIDVFLDRLEMCHTIDFRNRILLDFPTIPLSDLLLEKLQIVRINKKDIVDIVVLLREHDFGDGDRDKIDMDYIVSLLSRDWGFYYTVTQNLIKITRFLDELAILEKEDIDDVKSKINHALKTLENAPKSLRWKVRSIIGPRVKWYNEVEEIMR